MSGFEVGLVGCLVQRAARIRANWIQTNRVGPRANKPTDRLLVNHVVSSVGFRHVDGGNIERIVDGIVVATDIPE